MVMIKMFVNNNYGGFVNEYSSPVVLLFPSDASNSPSWQVDYTPTDLRHTCNESKKMYMYRSK